MAKIYTRTGDKGKTRLGDGSQVDKSDARVAAYGDVDELNAHLGLLLAQFPEQNELHTQLENIQHRLFDLGAELAAPGKKWIHQPAIDQMEAWIDELNGKLPPLKEFILPGGTPLAAQTQVARTVCRRAERKIVALGQINDVRNEALRYINRLSDYLFIAARSLNHGSGKEIPWQQGTAK